MPRKRPVKLPVKRPPRRENYLRIFVVESPDPLDAMQGRAEGPVIEVIGRLIGHEVLSFLARSRRELEETCRYIASIDPMHDSRDEPDRPLCLHISAHGNLSGLQFGGDTLRWPELVEVIQPLLSASLEYRGDRIVVLSACAADRQRLSRSIQQQARAGQDVTPPAYVFCTSGEVEWQDAAVGWAVFYHLLPGLRLGQKVAVQKVLDRVKEIGAGSFVYFRWHAKQRKYVRYAAT